CRIIEHSLDKGFEPLRPLPEPVTRVTKSRRRVAQDHRPPPMNYSLVAPSLGCFFLNRDELPPCARCYREPGRASVSKREVQRHHSRSTNKLEAKDEKTGRR